MTSLKVGKFESFSPPPSPPLSHLSILKSLFFSLDLSENTDMDKDTMEDDEFQGMYSNFAHNFFIFNNVHKYHKSDLTTTTTILIKVSSHNANIIAKDSQTSSKTAGPIFRILLKK